MVVFRKVIRHKASGERAVVDDKPSARSTLVMENKAITDIFLTHRLGSFRQASVLERTTVCATAKVSMVHGRWWFLGTLGCKLTEPVLSRT